MGYLTDLWHSWDDWVSVDRIRKENEENKELARNIKRQYDTTRQATSSKSGSSKKRGDDDDDKATGRGKRGRNMEIETVSFLKILRCGFACESFLSAIPIPLS
jgi:hypothetical protein